MRNRPSVYFIEDPPYGSRIPYLPYSYTPIRSVKTTMKIENARVKSVDFDREAVHGMYGRITHYTEGTTTLSVLLPPGSDGLLPEGLMDRKITIVIEPSPGEAAYLKYKSLNTMYTQTWEQLSPNTRQTWEQVAQAAVKAK